MTWHLFITKDRAALKTEFGIELLEFERDYHDNWHVRIPPKDGEYSVAIHEVSDKRLIQYCRGLVSNITNLKTTTIQVHDVRNQ